MVSVEQLASTPEEDVETKFVSTLLTYGLSSYKWSKALALTQAPAIDSPLQWLEEKVMETTTLGLKQVALTPEGVVAKLDGKASELNTAYELDTKFASSKTWSAKQLLKLKGEDAMTAELAEEIELHQLIADARAVAWNRVSTIQTRVTGLQTTASDKVDTLLEGAEGFVEKVFPAQEEGEAQAFEADADATKASRVRTLSTTVGRRFKKKALAKLGGMTLKLRDTQKVHLDLVRYSELLDIAAVRERVTAKYTDVSDTVTSSVTYTVVKGYVVTASDTTAKLQAGIKSNVEVRVLAPAKDFYAIATAEFIKRKESANDLIALGSESIGTRTEFATKYLESVKAALGSQWNDKLYAPSMKFLEKCEAEWAPLLLAYNEGVENPNNTTEDGKPLTIDAGVAAFVEALKMKLAYDWEVHVVPQLERLKGGFKGKEFKEVFVDAESA